jgi:AcrR family transcriptional regulator
MLSPDVVIEAGMRVLEVSGWEGLSLRAVAGELGVTPMALYRHVSESTALKAAVVEAVVDSMNGRARTGDLRVDLSEWARRLRDHLSRYPGVAGHLITNWFESPAILEQIDDMLNRLHRSGVDGFEAVASVNAVFMYALMRCEAERSVRNAGAVRRSLRTAAASRPLDRLNALAAHYTTAQFDAHFEFGLRSLITGMAIPAASGKEEHR